MYRVVRASILYYENHMRGSGCRYELIQPFLLLVSTNHFKSAKMEKTNDYLNLCDIIGKMKILYLTGESQYHHFDMLLKELDVLGFDVNDMNAAGVTHDDKLKDQIDLLLQFLAFRYPFDEYDNRTGIHDSKVSEFVFVQP